jgi:hypothetical protein
MKTALSAAAIGVAMLTGYGLSAPPAQAGYVVHLTQEGTDVVAIGSGPIDLTGLSFEQEGNNAVLIVPQAGVIQTGPAGRVDILIYTGVTGPMRFGHNDLLEGIASSGSGDAVGISGTGGVLFLPLGYVSDSPLSDTSTYANQTFSSIGALPGTYEWTWGTGANQNFTLEIGPVPEPSTWAMLLIGFGLLGHLGYRKRRGALA